MSAIPLPDPRKREKRVLLTGEVANPANPPIGLLLPPALHLLRGYLQNGGTGF